MVWEVCHFLLYFVEQHWNTIIYLYIHPYKIYSFGFHVLWKFYTHYHDIFIHLQLYFSSMLKVLGKAEEQAIKLPTSAGSSIKQESSRKTFISALLTMSKPLTVWITINCGKFWKRWEYQTTWLASWKTYMQVRKQQLELDMGQQTGSK